MSIIMKADGSPFETEKAAQMRAGILRKDGTEAEAVEVEGGYALKVISQERRKRVPLNKRDVLTVKDKDPNYEYRVVNDEDNGRISRFLDAGWEVDKFSEVGDPRVGRETPIGSATTKAVGGGKTAVVMRKKREWYDEDYADKQKINDKSEEGLIAHAAQGRYGKLEINKTKIDGELR